MSYLYRGVTSNHHEKHGGKLMPKTIAPFECTFKWDQSGFKWDSGSAWDASQANAVVRHQLNQKGFPTSGVSTTPHLNRAVIYAKGTSGTSDGYIYKIDRSLIKENGISEFIVAPPFEEMGKRSRHPNWLSDGHTRQNRSAPGPALAVRRRR